MHPAQSAAFVPLLLRAGAHPAMRQVKYSSGPALAAARRRLEVVELQEGVREAVEAVRHWQHIVRMLARAEAWWLLRL